MLDISKLYMQLTELGSYQAAQSHALNDAYMHAIDTSSHAKDNISEYRRKIDNSNTSWLVAKPTKELPFDVHDAPFALDSYAILSTDGSQISPDRHSTHTAYLINVGMITIGYGDFHGYVLENEPTAFFKSEDYTRKYGGEDRPVSGSVLAALRQKMETTALSEMVKSYENRPAIALVDGTLILWMLEQDAQRLQRLSQEDLKQQTFYEFMNLFRVCKETKIPVAGYISSPGGNDVINSLKVYLCPNEPVDCDKCLYKNDPEAKPCSAIDGITDAHFFKKLLINGQRSSLFESSSSILGAYKNDTVLFFYLNVGKEIARIEIPSFVAKENSLLNTVHAACLDQAEKGLGYPIAIAEAHEQAVVKSADKALFNQIITTILIQQGIPIAESRKSIQKRGSFI